MKSKFALYIFFIVGQIRSMHDISFEKKDLPLIESISRALDDIKEVQDGEGLVDFFDVLDQKKISSERGATILREHGLMNENVLLPEVENILKKYKFIE